MTLIMTYTDERLCNIAEVLYKALDQNLCRKTHTHPHITCLYHLSLYGVHWVEKVLWKRSMLFSIFVPMCVRLCLCVCEWVPGWEGLIKSMPVCGWTWHTSFQSKQMSPADFVFAKQQSRYSLRVTHTHTQTYTELKTAVCKGKTLLPLVCNNRSEANNHIPTLLLNKGLKPQGFFFFLPLSIY